MKTKLFLLLVLFGTVNVTKPTSFDNKPSIGGLVVVVSTLWVGALCVDQLLNIAQEYCDCNVSKIRNLQKECENKQIIEELRKRAFHFRVLNGLLYIPRTVTTIATYAIPAVTIGKCLALLVEK